MIRIQENTPTTVGSSNAPTQQQPRANYLLRQNNEDSVSFKGDGEQKKKNHVWGWIAGIAVVATGIIIAVKSKKGSEVNKAIEKAKDVEDLASNGLSKYDSFGDEAIYGKKYTNHYKSKNRNKHKTNKFKATNPGNVKTIRYEGALPDGKKFFVDLDKDGNVISIVKPDGSFTENPNAIKKFFKKNKAKDIKIKNDDSRFSNEVKKTKPEVKPEVKPEIKLETTPGVATKYSNGDVDKVDAIVKDVNVKPKKQKKQRVISEPKNEQIPNSIDSEIKPEKTNWVQRQVDKVIGKGKEDVASTVEDESGKVIKGNEPANVVKVKKQKVNNEIKPEVVVKEKPETFGKFKKLNNKVSNLVNKISENIDNYRNGIEETRIQNRANKLARKGAKHERDMEILAKKSQAADLASEFNNQKLGNKLAQNDIKVSIREQKLADNIAKREAALLIEKQNEALRLAEKEAMENLGNGVSSEVEGKRNGFFGLFKRTKESLPKPEAKLNEVKKEKQEKGPNYIQRKYAEFKANQDAKKVEKEAKKLAAKKPIDPEEQVKEPNYFQRKYAEFKANQESKKAARELAEEQEKGPNYLQRKYIEFKANQDAKKVEKEAKKLAAKKPIDPEEQVKEPNYFQRKYAEIQSNIAVKKAKKIEKATAKESLDDITGKQEKGPNYFQRKYAEVKANRDSKKAYKDFLKAVDELNNVNEAITVEKLNQKISGKKSKFSDAIDKVSGFFNRKQKPVEIQKVSDEITPDFEFNLDSDNADEVISSWITTKKKFDFSSPFDVEIPKNDIFDERKLNEFKSHSDISAYAKQQMAESNKNLINKFAKVTPKKHETRQQALDKAFGANKELDADIKAFDETSELRKIQKDLEITESWNDQQLNPIDRKYSLGKLFGKKERKEAIQIQNDIKKGFNEIEQQRKNAKLSITDEIELDDDAQAWLQRKK